MKEKSLDFIKVNPAGNMTILIENLNYENKDILSISEKIMKETNLYAEQVGFIKENHLQMMGGEFCGNASRSFASILAFRDKTFLKQKNYFITCSGEKEILEVDVRETENKNQFLAKIKMPKYLNISEIEILDKTKIKHKFILVEFAGIHHFIYQDSSSNREEIIELIKTYMKDKNYSAFGLMFFNKSEFSIIPYVYVKGFEDGVWENSCASGTTALGYYLKKFENIGRAKIFQPAGWLEFLFSDEDIYIDGPVEIVAEGKVYI